MSDSENRDALYVVLHHEEDYVVAVVKSDQSPSACMWEVTTELTCELKRLEHLDSGHGLLPEHKNTNVKALIGVQIELSVTARYDKTA